jgi:hypothetical protein
VAAYAGVTPNQTFIEWAATCGLPRTASMDEFGASSLTDSEKRPKDHLLGDERVWACDRRPGQHSTGTGSIAGYLLSAVHHLDYGYSLE